MHIINTGVFHVHPWLFLFWRFSNSGWSKHASQENSSTEGQLFASTILYMPLIYLNDTTKLHIFYYWYPIKGYKKLSQLLNLCGRGFFFQFTSLHRAEVDDIAEGNAFCVARDWQKFAVLSCISWAVACDWGVKNKRLFKFLILKQPL